MNKQNQRRRAPLKWKIFLWLAVFTGVIILLMWLLQSVFLARIYKSIKIREIESAADRLRLAIAEGDPASTVDEIASGGVCVAVYDVNYSSPRALFSNHAGSNCVIHSIDASSVMTLWGATIKNGEPLIQRFVYNPENGKYIGISGDFFEKGDDVDPDLPESIIYSDFVPDPDGYLVFILLNSTISPVGGTVRTLNALLGVMTGVLIFLALVMALIISRRISRPIARLTASARELARGNYDVRFEGGSYRESEDLSDALNYAEGELAKTDKLRRELIANVSHDLRTPLTMMIGYSEMMRDIPGENTPENIQVVIDETRRMSSLVNDLLDVSKLESGVGNSEPEPFDLTAAVQATLDNFGKLCERDGYLIEFFHTGSVRVNADEHRITQAVYNLVANALTHIGPDMRVTVTQEVRDGLVRISVADKGEGIPEDKLALIWERYYKVDKVHRRAAAGSGLGLSIVKKVMEQNGGSCGVASREGEGSVFWIELPVYQQTEIGDQ